MRACGECQLCCKIVPVSEIGKPADTRCRYQKHRKGCVVYATRPLSCKTWSCSWLSDPLATMLPRPDRAGYVIDMLPDFVKITYDDGAPSIEVPVLQIWAERKDVQLARDPSLRAYLAIRAEQHGMAALMRWPGNDGAMGIFAPSINATGQWQETESNFRPEMQHTRADIDRVLKDSGLEFVRD